MKRILFDRDAQRNINMEISKYIRMNNSKGITRIEDIISDEDFEHLIDTHLVDITMELPLWSFMELKRHYIDIVPSMDRSLVSEDLMKEYFQISLTGSDLMTLMTRELYYGQEHSRRLVLDKSVYTILEKDPVFSQDVKEVFKYYAALDLADYVDTISDNDRVLEEYMNSGYNKKILHGSLKYVRMTLPDLMTYDDWYNICAYRVSDYGDPIYNPTKDIFYKLKKFFKMDRDSRYPYREPYFDVLLG